MGTLELSSLSIQKLLPSLRLLILAVRLPRPLLCLQHAHGTVCLQLGPGIKTGMPSLYLPRRGEFTDCGGAEGAAVTAARCQPGRDAQASVIPARREQGMGLSRTNSNTPGGGHTLHSRCVLLTIPDVRNIRYPGEGRFLLCNIRLERFKGNLIICTYGCSITPGERR